MTLSEALSRNEFALFRKDANSYKALSSSGETVQFSSGKLEICNDPSSWFGMSLYVREALSDQWESLSREELNQIIWKVKA